MNNFGNLDGLDPNNNDFMPRTSGCNYYSLDEYTSLIDHQTTKNAIKIMNFNIRSFHSNGETFSSMLEVLPDLPDFLVLTESWNTVDNYEECNISNYKGHHTIREVSRGGGVSIFCHKKYNSSKISNISRCINVLETCVVKVELECCYIVVVGFYRPPNESTADFIEKLGLIIQHPVVRNAHLAIVAGDANINLNNLESPIVNDYLAGFQSSYFLPAITNSTRFPASAGNFSPSNLDHIFFNKTQYYESGILKIDITDHCPTFLHLPFFLNKPNNVKIKIQSRPYTQQNFEKFSNELSEFNWQFVDYNSLNVNINSFITKLNETYCKHFPLKTKYVSQKRLSKPWLTQRLKNLIRTKSDYYKLFRLGLLSKVTNDIHKKLVNSTIKKAKFNYYQEAFNQCKNDMKRSWSLIKGLMGRFNNKPVCKKLIYNDQTYSSDQDIAEAFNSHFTSVAQILANNLPLSETDPTYCMPNVPPNCFHLRPVTQGECLNIISSLKTTKTDTNSLPVKLFKSVSQIIVKPLCSLINASFVTGIFPEYFKTARISHIYKSGNPEDPSNHRPIATIPYLSKIFEKCICSRLLGYFDEFSLFSEVQYGFRKGKSTCDALMDMTEAIYDSLNKKKFHMNLLIDLRKAFDTISHDILLKKLQHYGVKNKPLDLIKSFLSDRKQFVKIGNHSSSLLVNPIGLPQGSNLGPTLFLIYLNDFPNVSNLLKSILFADDSSFSVSNTNYNIMVNTLNLEIQKIYQWTTANKLSINVSKTQLLNFSNRFPDLAQGSDVVSMGDERLDMVTSCKYLGVLVDNKLTFKQHICHVISKISKNTGILYRIRNNIPKKARIDYYYSLIYPYLTYNVIVWGGTFSNHLSNLIIQQKRTVRVLADLPYNEHISSIFYELKILKFTDIYKFYVSIYMFQNKNSEKFKKDHAINTRNRHLAQPSFNRLSICQHSVNYLGPHIWNNLPEYIRDLDSLKKFKYELKNYLIESYI